MSNWKSFRYKNISFFVASLILAFFLSRFESFHTFIISLGDLGYFGAFVAGILFVSTFTFATGAIILLVLAESLSPLEIGLFAGLGAVTGDFVIFKYVKNDLAEELQEIYKIFDPRHHFRHVLHSKYFSWTLPVIGSVIIASPLPDELGVSLMGISKMSVPKFLIISFTLNALGIFLVISASIALKP